MDLFQRQQLIRRKSESCLFSADSACCQWHLAETSDHNRSMSACFFAHIHTPGQEEQQAPLQLWVRTDQ